MSERPHAIIARIEGNDPETQKYDQADLQPGNAVFFRLDGGLSINPENLVGKQMLKLTQEGNLDVAAVLDEATMHLLVTTHFIHAAYSYAPDHQPQPIVFTAKGKTQRGKSITYAIVFRPSENEAIEEMEKWKGLRGGGRGSSQDQ